MVPAFLVGLIPAHAGSTVRQLSQWPAHTAHPRSRGEHYKLKTDIKAAEGSSPLTRGAQDGRLGRLDVDRLIPAHAGSTPGL